jgi:hypothetical protein
MQWDRRTIPDVYRNIILEEGRSNQRGYVLLVWWNTVIVARCATRPILLVPTLRLKQWRNVHGSSIARDPETGIPVRSNLMICS